MASNPNREWVIYVLLDPRNLSVRYVGVTVNLERRMKEHTGSDLRSVNHRTNWVKSLIKLGLKPVPRIIMHGSGPGWKQEERKWIAKYRNAGTPLTNGTDGGDGTHGRVWSEQQRQHMRDMMKGRTVTWVISNTWTKETTPWKAAHEAAKLQRAAGTFPKRTQEWIDKNADWHRGRKRPEAACVKMRERVRATRAGIKLTYQMVVEIKTSTEKQCVLARKYGVSQSMVSQIKLGKIYAYVKVPT